MSNIAGIKSLLRSVSTFVTWLYNITIDGDTGQIIPGPILNFAKFIEDHAVVFIFVVAVPLVGLGIGLLRRMLNA